MQTLALSVLLLGTQVLCPMIFVLPGGPEARASFVGLRSLDAPFMLAIVPPLEMERDFERIGLLSAGPA